MAAKPAAVGSATWISAEKENTLQLLEDEKEEVAYPAKHQLEWLNEHMAEIFSKSQVDVTNIFKTPGKLRGKTPQTARKRNAQDARIPLSDVFSSKPIPRQSPQKQQTRNKPHFEIATDTVEQQQTSNFRSQTDSGYHGSSQDEMEVDTGVWTIPTTDPKTVQISDASSDAAGHDIDDTEDGEHRTTEGSFHSAKEDQTAKITGLEASTRDRSPENTATGAQESVENKSSKDQQPEPDFDEIGSPSDESTPDRPLVRKSSLTFASLPAREPMKTSIGGRVSRTSHVEQSRLPQPNHYSSRQVVKSNQFEQKSAQTKNLDVPMKDLVDEDEEDENVEILGHDDSDEDIQIAKNHSKSSTQRLHEKIDMLGKAPPPRPSKSIPSATALGSMKQTEDMEQAERTDDQAPMPQDDDDDWIKPLTSPNAARSSPAKGMTANSEHDSDEDEFDIRAPELIAHEERMRSPVRMSPGPGRMMPGYGHAKSASTATLASPAKSAMAPPPSPAKSMSISHPSYPTTTPQGSPKRYLDLSASKSKLQSIMKTAKGLFTTSASVSAAAKLETLSPNAVKIAANAMPGMYPNLDSLFRDKPLPASPPKESRKTRGSTEKEREEKRKEKDTQLRQRMDEQLEQAREKERQKATEKNARSNKIEQQATFPSPERPTEGQTQQEMAEPAQPARKPSRPVRPATREPPVNKAKPVPVSIRVGTLSQRMPPNSGHGAPSTQEVLSAEPKRPGLNKKASTASLQSTTTNTLKSSVHGQPPKPRALLAAERKREQEEREAQRKLEQKREIERKRAAQQEETRKQEQKQRAEAEKRERERLVAEQAKRQAQQQAIERKRQEAARKAEQQRLDRAATEASQARPSSRLASQTVGRSLINHPLPTNPAKPAKRPLDEDAAASRAPNAKYGTGVPQGDVKRRKTEEDSVLEPAPRPMVSGAPIRQSQLGKKPSIFHHSTYTQAQPSGHLGQFPQPPTRAAPPQMQQYATGAKIPFADAPNPPAHAKTPVSIMQQKTIQTVKSSPQYANGDGIHLPEIPTDSEDEDSDDEANAFPIPDWATPGHLTEQLIRQEGMDGDAVFGPIAPLKMEEIFAKGNKDRLKRLRDRTSSANWAHSGDGLTLEEVRVDREQRERMRVEGGWRFGH